MSNGNWHWRDLMTTDPEASEAFYTSLFGWRVEHQDMGDAGVYRMLFAGERRLGGIMGMSAADAVANHWVGYAGVRDVDVAVSKAEGLGATVGLEPRDIPAGAGRFALLIDPQGGPFMVIALADPPAPPDYAPGTFCWMELHTPDLGGSQGFYGELIGWEFGQMELPSGADYVMARSMTADVGGMMAHVDPDCPSAWMQYISVADAARAANRAEQLSATIVLPPTDVPGVGRIAIFTDNVGAGFAVLQAG